MRRLYLSIFLFIILTLIKIHAGEELDLHNCWKYYIGDQHETPVDIENKIFLPINYGINQKNISCLIPGKEGFIWLKKEFILPQNLSDKKLSMLLGKIIIAGETYFNGKYLGIKGKFPPDFYCAWNEYQIFELPENLIYKDKTNIILMKIYVNGEGSISGILKLGEKDKILSEYRILKFFDMDTQIITSILILVFCIYHLLLFIKRPVEHSNLYYSLLCFSVLLYQQLYYLSGLVKTFNLKMDYFLYLRLSNYEVFFIFFFLCLFLTNFLNYKKTIIENYFLIALLVIPIVLTSIFPVYKYFIVTRRFANIFLFGNIIYTLIIILHSVRKKIPNAVSIFFITIAWFVCVIFDIIFHAIFINLVLPYLSVVGFAVFIIGIAMIMANKFVNLYKELEFLNINLEKKVLERTLEIKNANESLIKTNTKLQEAQNKLLKYATTDHLTGLYNRFELQKRLEEEISRIKRYKNKSNKCFTVIFLDLDNFKYYNDTFGHEVGDLILVEFSRILKMVTRKVDIISRFGGDEFIIVLPETDKKNAMFVVERIYKELEKTDFFKSLVENYLSKKITIKEKDKLSCSIGITEAFENIEQNVILQKADKALYSAKKKGKNTFYVWKK